MLELGPSLCHNPAAPCQRPAIGSGFDQNWLIVHIHRGKKMAFYESVFIARQDVTPQQVEQMAEQFAGIINAQGGKVTKTENWGLRTLAYKINKNRKGHYILMNLDAPAAAVHELERNLRINEDILRFMTIRVDEVENGPSIMMRKNEERYERDDRGFGGRGGDRGGDRGYRPRPARNESEGDDQ